MVSEGASSGARERVMKYTGKSRRLRERLKLALPVRVQCRETPEQEWVEVTRLIDVTPFGAGFTLRRITEPGRLLHLTLPMPRQLRCFDYVEQQYRVWALIRHLKRHEPDGAAQRAHEQAGAATGAAARFEVGVAFIGAYPPASYLKDPTTRYEVAPSPGESGLWSVREKKETDEGAGGDATHAGQRSAETRLQVPLDVLIEVVNEQGETEVREQTVTENLSRRGAAVYTSLRIERGSFVRMTNVQTGLVVFAAVRARRTGADGIPRLHLEFIDQLWPLEGME